MPINASLYQIALTRIPQVGVITAKNLIAWCGGAEAVFRAKKATLLKVPGVGPGIVAEIHAPEALKAAEQELVFMEKNGVTGLFYTDAAFPERLRSRIDCPVMVFFKGSDPALLEAERMVAIVGTRKISDHGKAICEEIVAGLLPYNVVMVSGLAYGIDITAHRKATSIGMPNIGVLGHGLGSIYPTSHKSTALRMMESGGLLSEYLHNAGPDREHFPMRNRIISGLCEALIVVETGLSGGSMISVEFATKHNLDIFAVPGRPQDPQSAGCNRLIKQNRAKLIESATDVAETMGWEKSGQQKAVQAQLFPDLSPEEQQIIEIVRTNPNIAIDDLILAANKPPGEIATLILHLEFKGLLKTQPGKRYLAMGYNR
jgi:DNA processing protein